MMWLLSNCNGKWMTTRCMMMHSWPHKMVNTVMSKDLGSTDQGCGAKNKADGAMKAQWLPLDGVSGRVIPNSLQQH